MNELTAPELKRPMDRTLMGNDGATLRNLVGMLNNPAITGAVVPPEEKLTTITAPMPPAGLPREKAMAAATLKQNVLNSAVPLMPQTPFQKRDAVAEADKAKATLFTQTVTNAAPVTTHTAAQKLFFTGHSRSGKSYLAEQAGARVFEFSDPIYAIAASAFGALSDPSTVAILDPFVQEITAWGEGIVSNQYPLTGARAVFCDNMHEAGEAGDKLMGVPVSEFGTPGFWTRCLLARVTRYLLENPTGRVAVTGITQPQQYTLLREQGFRHYHVACHGSTRASRGATAEMFNAIAQAVEQDITNKISREPAGEKLRCIWNENKIASPSARFLSLQDFLAAYK